MEIKRQKINKAKIKNSFIDVILIFKFDFWYIHSISEKKIENVNRVVRFENKPLHQKEEILLNDYLKRELRKVVDLLKLERLKIDIDVFFMKFLEYNEKENILTKKKFNDENDDDESCCLCCTVTSKRLTKKNCDTDENKFSIKILNTKQGEIGIGLRRSVFNIDNVNHWCYLCGFKLTSSGKNSKEKCYPTIKVKIGDIISLIYNSKKGELKLKINDSIMLFSFSGLSIKEDYKFELTLYNRGDKIQIIE